MIRTGKSGPDPSGRSLAVCGAGGHPLAGISVFLFCENANDARLLAQLLHHAGARVETPPLRGEIPEGLSRRTDTIALFDVDNPSGMEALRAVAAAGRPTPLLALTTDAGDPEIVRRLGESGAMALLGKPVMDPGALVAAVAALLGRDVLPDPDCVADAGILPRSREDDTGWLDTVLTMGTPAHAAELLDALHTDLERVHRDLSRAIDCIDLEDVRTETHILIGLSGGVGAAALLAEAQALNRAAREARVDCLPDIAGRITLNLEAMLEEIRLARPRLPAPSSS